MNNKNYEEVNTYTGKTVKFNEAPASDLLIDLPNGMLLGVNISISCVDCYLPDGNGIYQYAGDLSFGNDSKNNNYVQFHSRGIVGLNFNDENVPVPKGSNTLANVKIDLSVNKSMKWFDSLSKKF